METKLELIIFSTESYGAFAAELSSEAERRIHELSHKDTRTAVHMPVSVALAAPRMLEALENFCEWHADHFGDFGEEVNMQLLCLDNEAAAAIRAAKGDT